MTFMVVIAKEYQETVFPFGNILITIWLVSVNLCLIQVDNYGFYNFAEKFEVWNPILGGKWQISSLSNIRIFKLIIRIFISVNIRECIRIIIIRISSLLRIIISIVSSGGKVNSTNNILSQNRSSTGYSRSVRSILHCYYRVMSHLTIFFL